MKVSFNLPKKYVDLLDNIKESDDSLLTRTSALIKVLSENKEEKIIRQLIKLRKENTVENPNFETASWLLKGIDKLIKEYNEREAEKE